MEPIVFQGDAFSTYFCTRLLWEDTKLKLRLDVAGAEATYRKIASGIRYAQRQLKDRLQAKSTETLLLPQLRDILGWEIGSSAKVAAGEDREEDAGRALTVGKAGRVVARILCVGPEDSFDAAPSGLHRRFAPSYSLPRVLQELSLDYGILLNADSLRLVYGGGALPSYIEFDLTAIAEGTAAGAEAWKLLYNLLRQSALESQPTLLDTIRTVGKEHQERVSTDLGYQVQQAVMFLMQGIIDRNRDKLPHPISADILQKLYQETLRLLYRLLFVLYAEDLGLLPMEMPTYRDGYSLKRLVQLARDNGAGTLEKDDPNGSFFQDSLQALFSLLRQGLTLGTEGEIKPYGGGLFDPAATAFIDTLRWGNQTVDDLLECLTLVPAPKGQSGKVRLSYRELNVEQLGSVYEGLLELSPAYADHQMWRVSLDGQELVIDDDMRQRLAAKRGEVLTDAKLRTLQDDELADETDDNILDEDEVEVTEDAEASSDEDGEAEDSDSAADDAAEAVAPKGPKKPLRVVQEPVKSGTVYLRGGMGRKQTGSYYTNRAFVDFLVRQAVDPLAQGKTPKEILGLRCCDMAMGSGHFLVGVCRRLGDHLLAAYRRELTNLKADRGSKDFTDDDLLVVADLPEDLRYVWNSGDEERILAACRLLIAGNCIYGVDKNPLSVDLAKVSIWLITAASRQPLSFLDHRLQCGDSLLGLPAAELVKPYRSRKVKGKTWAAYPTLCTDEPDNHQNLHSENRAKLCTALKRAWQLLGLMQREVDRNPANFQAHQAAHKMLTGHLKPLHDLHQLRVGLAFEPVAGTPAIQLPDRYLDSLLCSGGHIQPPPEDIKTTVSSFIARGDDLRAFCWELTFPEVFFDSEGEKRKGAGFDVLVGNPPWDKVKPVEKEFFAQYDPTIIDYQGRASKEFIRQIMVCHDGSGDAWAAYQKTIGLYKQKMLRDGLTCWQQDTVPNEKTGKPKTTGGDADLFKFFTERFFTLLAPERDSSSGRMAILVPAAFYAAEGSKGLRRMVLERGRIESLYSYENHFGIFPAVHKQFKFCALVVSKRPPSAQATFPAAFMLHMPEWLTASPSLQASRKVLLSPSIITTQSPTHLSLLEFRNEQEKALIERIYADFPPLGKRLVGKWNVEFCRELDMTNDSWLFRERERLREFGGEQQHGEKWLLPPKDYFESRSSRFAHVTRAVNQLRGKRVEEPAEEARLTFSGYVLQAEAADPAPQIMVPGGTYVALYEGRMVHQFDQAPKYYVSGYGAKQIWEVAAEHDREARPHYFVCKSQVEAYRGKRVAARLAWCDVSNSRNERSLLSCLLSPDAMAGNTVPTIAVIGETSDDRVRSWLLAVLNSFVSDWEVRHRYDTHINFFVLNPLRVPRDILDDVLMDEVDRLVQVAGRPQKGNVQAAGRRDRAGARAKLDATVARTMGLSPHELAFVLTFFPLLDRDQPSLPGDGFISYSKGGKPKFIPRSFITRDALLLEYMRMLGQKPPHDVVAFFAEAGTDIDGGRILAGGTPADPLNPPICATGPLRSLEERVRIAEEQLGAVAYVPTMRKKPTEEAAAKAVELAERLGIDLRTGLPVVPQTAGVETYAPKPPLVFDVPTEEETGTDAELAVIGKIGPGDQTTRTPGRKSRKGTSDEFRQAAIMTFLTDEIIKTGKWATRLRVQKYLYFAIEIARLQVKAQFTRKAGGMYDSTLKYGGPEGIAVRNGYLKLTHGRFERGDKLQAGLQYVERYIGDHRPAIMELIKHFTKYHDETLGRWSTVHDAARQIIDAGQEPTVEGVKAILHGEKEWEKKLESDEYSDQNIQNTLNGLKSFGFLVPVVD